MSVTVKCNPCYGATCTVVSCFFYWERENKMKKGDCLQTPEYIYREFGEIDLDPCAGVDTTIGKMNYAIERGEDGLELPWAGFVFCNPPFSEKERWIDKMIKHGNGILLLPERGSAPWCGPLALECRFHWVMGKKINFIGGTSSNNLGSIIFLFGMDAVKRVSGCNLPWYMSGVYLQRNRQS